MYIKNNYYRYIYTFTSKLNLNKQRTFAILAITLNRCVDSRVFPNPMRKNKVKALLKKSCSTEPTNFRPISVLPASSKIFE